MGITTIEVKGLKTTRISGDGNDVEYQNETILFAAEQIKARVQKDPTDLARFIAVYKSFGISCEVQLDTAGHKVIYFRVGNCRLEGETMSADTFLGFTGFYTRVIFSLEGKFISQGFWE